MGTWGSQPSALSHLPASSSIASSSSYSPRIPTEQSSSCRTNHLPILPHSSSSRNNNNIITRSNHSTTHPRATRAHSQAASTLSPTVTPMPSSTSTSSKAPPS